MISFKCSAACGDIIYTLPSVKELWKQNGFCEVVYYIDNKTHSKRQNVDTYKALKLLLEDQEYISKCLPYDGQKVVFDFDGFRRLDYKKEPMPLSMGKAIGLNDVDYKSPWIDVELDSDRDSVLFNITKRYKGNSFKFLDKAQELFSQFDNLWFLGFYDEFLSCGLSAYCHFCTESYNLYEAMLYIAEAKEIYCNQSSVLTIAQAMNHPNINLFYVKGFNNVLLGKENVYEAY